MSQTLAVTRDKVRELLMDLAIGTDAAVSPITLDRIIDTVVQEVAPKAGLGQTRDTSFVTLVSGTYRYTIAPTGSNDFLNLYLVLYQGTNESLTKRSEEWIEDRRSGSGTPATGQPTDYAITFGADQTWTLLLDPTPGSAESGVKLTGYYRIVPSALSSDSTSIPFDDGLMRATEQIIASRCAMSIQQARREEMGLSDNYISTMERSGWAMVRDAYVRNKIGRFQDVVEPMGRSRWPS